MLWRSQTTIYYYFKLPTCIGCPKSSNISPCQWKTLINTNTSSTYYILFRYKTVVYRALWLYILILYKTHSTLEYTILAYLNSVGISHTSCHVDAPQHVAAWSSMLHVDIDSMNVHINTHKGIEPAHIDSVYVHINTHKGIEPAHIDSVYVHINTHKRIESAHIDSVYLIP